MDESPVGPEELRRGRGGRGARTTLLVACALAVALSLLPRDAVAGQDPPSAAPDLAAAAWVLIDPRDGRRLAAHAPGEQRSIASTTKLMTAYLALEDLRLRERLTVPPYTPAPAESVVGLTEGEELTVRDLLLAMMLPSANDAAETVAVGVAGSEGDFVERMNRAAADLGLEDTRYSNPIGLDEIGNYSSAADLAALTTTLMNDGRFREIVDTPEADLKSGSVPRHVVSRNALLLADPSVDGVKTGHTLDAGYVLVSSARRRGVPLIAVVLGAAGESERDAESARLLDYGYSLYERRSPFEEGEELASADVRYEDDRLAIVPGRRLAVEARADQELTAALDAPGSVEGPIDKGEVLGRATVSLDGKVIGRVPLLAASAIGAPSFVDRIGGAPVLAAIVIGAIVILLLVVLALRRRSAGRRRGRSAEERMRSHNERTRRREGGES